MNDNGVSHHTQRIIKHSSTFYDADSLDPFWTLGYLNEDILLLFLLSFLLFLLKKPRNVLRSLHEEAHLVESPNALASWCSEILLFVPERLEASTFDHFEDLRISIFELRQYMDFVVWR